MDTTLAFAIGQANREKEPMVFDWDKAARIIKDRKPAHVSAGLHLDWEYTGGGIYTNGAPIPSEDTYVYLMSTWAVPEIEVDGDVEDCFVMLSEKPEWNRDTYWPQSALDILNKED